MTIPQVAMWGRSMSKYIVMHSHVFTFNLRMFFSPTETEFVVLDFCPVDGTDLVVEATDVVEEGDYRSNAEGQGEQGT